MFDDSSYICIICKTEIKVGESFYHDRNRDDECEGHLHSDCFIRELEFRGCHKAAGQIQDWDLETKDER